MVDIKFHCDENAHFSDGFKVHAFTYKDYSIEMHSHDFYEVNIVLSGSGTHCIETGEFEVKAGDVFVIPPMVAHAYIHTSELEIYHILMQKEYFGNNKGESEGVNGFLQLTEIEPFLRSNFSNAFFLRLTPKQQMLLKNELSFLDDNGDFPWSEFSLMKYHTVWKLLYWFSGLLREQIKSSHRNKKNKYEIQILKSLEYIHRCYTEKITVETLCKSVFLSRSTFLRSFREVCGMSPIEYLNNYRCKKATELLDTAAHSKTEIAHTCGFYDLSHMERMLKKHR